MLGEFYFMALGALGVSLAGFAGLITALDQRSTADSVVVGWRIRNIVIGGFVLTFGGFGTVALYSLTDGDLPLTIRASSLLLAAAHAAQIWSALRPGPEWGSESGRKIALTTGGTIVLGLSVNVALADLGLLQLLFLSLAVGPASVFVTTVREVARR